VILRTLRIAAALAIGCGSERGIEVNPDGPAPASCAADENDDPASAPTLVDGEAVEGHVCPLGDADVFRFGVPAGSDLVAVELANGVPLSAVDLSYLLLGADGRTALGGAGDDDGADGTTAVAHHHRAESGETLFVLVRDGGDDEQDVRNPYTLRVAGASDPDAHEPNDSIEVAAPLAGTASGYVASLGDTDVWAADLAAGTLLDLEVVAAGLAIGLRVSWLDPTGLPLLALEAPTPGVAEVGVRALRAVPAAGTYFFVVSAYDGVSEDFDTPYTITAGVLPEPDPHELPVRNDSAATATPLFGAAPWDGTAPASDSVTDGRVASGGDQDWYSVDLSVPGIVDVSLNGPPPVTWSLNLISPDPDTPCVEDDECVTLSSPCEADWQCLSSVCSGAVGGSCPGGTSCFCQGAGVCLPESVCGVAQFSRAVGGGGPGAITAQPLFAAGRTYLVVADQSGSATSPDPYSLTVGLRADPDGAEPDNDYDPYPLNSTPAEPSLCDSGGAPCTARPLAMGATATGHIAYEADFDYLRLELPCCDVSCPCGSTADACGFVLEFGADAGPVDVVWELFAGSAGGAAYWGGFDLALVPDGVLGDDECFIYSRFVDIAAGESVYVRVRDDLDDGAQWHAGQAYSVRLAGAVAGCPAGCSTECTDFCGEPCTAPDTPAGCCDHDPSGTPGSCASEPAADGPTDGPADGGADGPAADM
jgi:hypothetical protein